MRVWLTAVLLSVASLAGAQQTILNSSYDIARELFQAYNPEFQATGRKKPVRTSPSNSPTPVPPSRPAPSSKGWTRTW
ncbi:hypothetical protein ASALC70_03387 [Alcanivorax sp. ALC70]|nr:hypothetical protein ASALC70_03387 [Alcanivorax sp. ALC70]